MATNGLSYELVVGVPTITITDTENYSDCASWFTVFGGCP
jgi:hypothetical protein